MSSSPNPFANPEPGVRPPDRFDGLLRAYFRKEMPEPWPDFRPPAEPLIAGKPIRSARRPLRRSRLALAASLLLLFVGHLCLSGRSYDTVPASPEGSPSHFEATNRSGLAPLPGKVIAPRVASPKKESDVKGKDLAKPR
jgi:hypothetical protein